MQISAAIMQNSLMITQKIKIEPPYDSAIPLPGVNPKVVKPDVCSPLHRVALFSTVKIRNQPKYPSDDEWTKEARQHTQWKFLKGNPVI